MSFTTTHPVLGEYLQYTRNTESPALYHAWAFLSGISAAMGRRCYYRFGTYTTLPNMFVVLCGPPALRKSSAINPVRELLMENTGVRLAPSDTGGQRQGLIDAMIGSSDDDNEKLGNGDEKDEFFDASGRLLATLTDADLDKLGSMSLDTRDPNSMYILAPKLGSIIGENNGPLLTFMEQLYDGDDYSYRLKRTKMVLKDSVLGMLAGTTSSAFAQSLPNPIIGQDFMARCMFVYADEKKIKKIPRPSLVDGMKPKFAQLFSHIAGDLDGEFNETKEAAELFDKLYLKATSLMDTRFIHYVQRRQTHLQKVSMAFAAARLSKTIERVDVEAADALMRITEDGMPYALGEYGLSKLSQAKARLTEWLVATTEPLPLAAVYAAMAKDMRKDECTVALEELYAANRIKYLDVETLGRCVIGIGSDDAARALKRQRKRSMLTQAAEFAKQRKRVAAQELGEAHVGDITTG